MVYLKMAGLSVGAIGLPFVGFIGGIGQDAAFISNQTPTFVLAVTTLAFAGTIVRLFTLLVRTQSNHHAEWVRREEAMKEERASRDHEFKELIRGNTAALRGVEIAVGHCAQRQG